MVNAVDAAVNACWLAGPVFALQGANARGIVRPWHDWSSVMRLAAVLAAAALLAVPAIAEPAVKASMPAIRASVVDGDVVVRLDQGVLGSARSLEPRTVVLVARDASGKIVAETSTKVSRRMTYARTALTPALAGASTITVSVK
jgi:hypothetical protein